MRCTHAHRERSKLERDRAASGKGRQKMMGPGAWGEVEVGGGANHRRQCRRTRWPPGAKHARGEIQCRSCSLSGSNTSIFASLIFASFRTSVNPLTPPHPNTQDKPAPFGAAPPPPPLQEKHIGVGEKHTCVAALALNRSFCPPPSPRGVPASSPPRPSGSALAVSAGLAVAIAFGSSPLTAPP